jgi:VanZ family protein
VLAYPSVSKLRIGVWLMVLGVLIEVLQYLGGYRFGDWQDAVADGVGVLVGLGVVRGFDKFIKKSAYENL